MFRQLQTIKNEIIKVSGYVVAYRGYKGKEFFLSEMKELLVKLNKELRLTMEHFDSLEE